MNLPNRKLPRLSKYNYANEGYYFVTICTHNKIHLFGDMTILNRIGIIAENELINITKHFENVKIDKYVVMPNHIHCIIIIGCDDETEWGTERQGTERSRPFPTVSTVVGLYKSGVSKMVHVEHPDVTVWQKSFHDRIIRNKTEYQRIWKYIDENPAKWAEDRYFK